MRQNSNRSLVSSHPSWLKKCYFISDVGFSISFKSIVTRKQLTTSKFPTTSFHVTIIILARSAASAKIAEHNDELQLLILF